MEEWQLKAAALMADVDTERAVRATTVVGGAVGALTAYATAPRRSWGWRTLGGALVGALTGRVAGAAAIAAVSPDVLEPEE
mgnify:CR=1 FL=1